MVSKKAPALSSSLIAVKGQATAAPDVAVRQPAPSLDAPVKAPKAPANAPLNFKVDQEFRRRFRQRAAEADLKLHELLREALDAWEEKRRAH